MPDTLVLGFDTSAAHCAAALLSGDRLLAHRFQDMAKGQAEQLFPLLEQVLADAGKGWADLAAIGVGTGPGNFTGVRIAVAAARGLALSLGIPAVGVPVTEALALRAPRPCRIIVPARAGQVIWQDFGAGDSAPQIAAPDALPPGPPVHPVTFAELAPAIAALAQARAADPGPRPAPVYLRPADTAPARDRGPVILT